LGRHRIVPGEVLSDREIRTLMGEIGVTRIGCTTLLDRLGIPTHYCVRPSAMHPCAIYSSGKGLTDYQAIISSLFESYERWAAESPAFQIVATKDEIVNVASKQGMLVLTPGNVDGDLSRWAFGRDIGTNQLAAAPLNLVQFPSNDTISLSRPQGSRLTQRTTRL